MMFTELMEFISEVVNNSFNMGRDHIIFYKNFDKPMYIIHLINKVFYKIN